MNYVERLEDQLAGLEMDCDKMQKRINELEDRLEVWSVPDEKGHKLWLDIGDCDGIGCRDTTISLLEERINELEDGLCRFNCRTGRDAFIAGYELAHGWGLSEREKEVIGGRCFEKWKSECEK